MMITALLSMNAADDRALDEQTARALATSNCPCGCPSIDLFVGTDAAISTTHAETEFIGVHKARGLAVILSVRHGRLRELDCISSRDETSFPQALSDLDGWNFSA